MNLTQLLKKPVITEKSLKAAAKGKFTFVVNKTATKPQIRQAVEAAFGVNVTGIATSHTTPQAYRTGKRRRLKLSAPQKKAVISLKSGQNIKLFDINPEEK